MTNLRIKIGEKTNRLTLLEYKGSYKGHCIGLFKCECGLITEKRINRVYNNQTKSCGCYNKELSSLKFKGNKNGFKHGYSKKDGIVNSLFYTYSSMKQRCTNPKSLEYNNYGGRGIIICDEWLNSYESFYLWATNKGYKKGLHIDRVNNDGNYEPNNCRFVTPYLNNRNKRVNIWVEYKGEAMILKDLSTLTNVYANTIKSRMKKGMSAEEAVSIPNRKGNKLDINLK